MMMTMCRTPLSLAASISGRGGQKATTPAAMLAALKPIRGATALRARQLSGQGVGRVAEVASQRPVFFCSAADAAADGGTAAVEDAPIYTRLDIRVGKILSIEKHPEADTLYVEQVDCGEEQPRTIVSGLVDFVSVDEMQDSMVVVLANLKPRNMRGIKSAGMLLCASNEAHDVVEPLRPPAAAVPGERIGFGDDFDSQPDADTPNRVQKKKVWEATAPGLKTSDDCVATFEGTAMNTSAGPVTCKSLTGANIG